MVDFSADSIVAAARRKTALHDFHDESFLEPLEIMLRATNKEANLKETTIEQFLSETVELVATRLRMDDYFRNHPEIANQKIVAPLIIVGMQRTGTSKLFRLIANDPQWNALITWQALNPVPLQAGDDCGESDSRIALAHQWVSKQGWKQAAHTNHALAPEMEALLLFQTFMFHNPSRLIPTHQNWTRTADYRPAYRHLRRLLQFLQWQNRSPDGRRWILKYPAHLQNLPALMEVFPDARLVMTHRHPASSVPSMLRFAELAQKNAALDVDYDKIRQVWLSNLIVSIERFMQFRREFGDGKFIDVGYRDVVRDSINSVQRIYCWADADYSDATIANMRSWELNNPKNKDGAYEYSLETYGLTKEDIDRHFAEYIDAYGSYFM